MKTILRQLEELCQHPEPNEQVFADASSYLHDANEIAAQCGVDPETVYEFTNPIRALAAVRRLIAQTDPERFLLIRDAAKILSVSQDKVAEWIKANRLEAVNVANTGKRPQYRIPRDALRNLQPETKYKPRFLTNDAPRR